MKSIHVLIILTLLLLIGMSCGQDDLDIPEPRAVGACGDHYPGAGSDDTSENAFAIEEGKTFPCIAFETARLAGEDTYILMADEYLKANLQFLSHPGELFNVYSVLRPSGLLFGRQQVFVGNDLHGQPL
jgi:hypothetical protein